MKIVKKFKKEKKIVQKIICNKCEVIMFDIEIDRAWGLDDKDVILNCAAELRDMEDMFDIFGKYKTRDLFIFDLCKECTKELISKFKIPPQEEKYRKEDECEEEED